MRFLGQLEEGAAAGCVLKPADRLGLRRNVKLRYPVGIRCRKFVELRAVFEARCGESVAGDLGHLRMGLVQLNPAVGNSASMRNSAPRIVGSDVLTHPHIAPRKTLFEQPEKRSQSGALSRKAAAPRKHRTKERGGARQSALGC